jgi:hypothetical protein
LRNSLLEKAFSIQNNQPVLSVAPENKLLVPERILWISLLAMSLLTIGGLVFHLKKSQRKSLLK